MFENIFGRIVFVEKFYFLREKFNWKHLMGKVLLEMFVSFFTEGNKIGIVVRLGILLYNSIVNTIIENLENTWTLITI